MHFLRSTGRFLMGFLPLIVASHTAAQTTEYERARQLLTSGRANEAAVIYQDLLRNQPDNPDLLVNLSIALYQTGHFREAAGSAAAALKLAPGLLPANLFLGASHFELGDYAKAIESLEPVVAASPRDRNARLMLAESLLGIGSVDAAIKHFKAVSEMLPDNSRVWYGLAKSYEAAGQKDAAIHASEQLLKLPPSVHSHFHLAEKNVASLRWREAAAEWNEALKLAADSLKARSGLAWSLFRSRDYQGAIAALKPVLTSRPNAEVQFLYGASLLNLGQPLEGMPHLRSAIEKDPGLLPARAALGQALLLTGKPADAIPLLEGSKSVDPDGSLHFQLFRAYQLTGRKVDAQQALAAYRRLRAVQTPAQ
jgi:tetratricopeptide (TPR) repeat protein